MIFPKKQGQRLIPEYLLDYTTKLQNSHPDPTDSWGGSGGSYTGGDGIDISTENVISVDNTIAKKSDIPSRVKSPFLGVRQTTDGTVLFSETGEDNDYYSVYHVTEPVKVNLRSLNTKFGNGLTSSYNTSTRALDVAVDTTTVALKSDIPSLDGYATQTWVQNQGYSTFSGSYNDLTDKPVIPDTSNFVTLDTNQTITGTKQFAAPVNVISPMLSRSTQLNGEGAFVYKDGVKDEVTIFGLPRSKTGGTEANPTEYTLATTDDIPTVPTLATVATTGSYNDLIDKPTIPDTTKMVTTDTNQTISGFKTFDSAKLSVERLSPIPMKLTFRPNMFMYYSGDSVAYFNLPTSKPKGTPDAPTEYTLATTDDIVDATNFVTLDTAQTISGAKTFQNGLITENTTFGMKMNIVPSRFQYDYNNRGTIERTLFDLPTDKTAGTEGQPTTYTIATKDDIPTSATSTSTVTPTTETLVFTLSDNSTVTVNVMTGATVSTTTTLS